MFGKIINGVLNLVGLNMSRHQTTQYLISQGKFRWLQEREINTVIDIGANTGQFAKFINEVIPQATIHSFEPLNVPFQNLIELKKSIPKLHCYQFAIGAKNGEIEINENDFSASSSILPMTKLHVSSFPFTKHSTVKTIAIHTLDCFISEIKPKKQILLKIDVQGFEMEVLKGANKFLDLVDVVIVETSFYELYKGQPLFPDVYNYLTKKQFTYSGNFEQIFSTVNGEVLQADAIFLKQTK